MAAEREGKISGLDICTSSKADSEHCRPSYTVSGRNPFKGMIRFHSDSYRRISILMYPGCIVGVANAFIISRKDWYRHFAYAILRLYMPAEKGRFHLLARSSSSSANGAIVQSIGLRYGVPLFFQQQVT